MEDQQGSISGVAGGNLMEHGGIMCIAPMLMGGGGQEQERNMEHGSYNSIMYLAAYVCNGTMEHMNCISWEGDASAVGEEGGEEEI